MEVQMDLKEYIEVQIIGTSYTLCLLVFHMKYTTSVMRLNKHY